MSVKTDEKELNPERVTLTDFNPITPYNRNEETGKY